MGNIEILVFLFLILLVFHLVKVLLQIIHSIDNLHEFLKLGLNANLEPFAHVVQKIDVLKVER